MENSVVFKNSHYPIRINLVAGNGLGAVLFENSFSEISDEDYDVILIQGEMPEPGINLEVVLQPNPDIGRNPLYTPTALKRFPNGRFWAKYRVGALTRQALKICVRSAGLTTDSILIIYGIEILNEAEAKETISPVDYP